MKKIKNLITLILLLICSGGCSDITPVELGSIIGTVTDGTIMEPLQGVSVSIAPTGKTMTTGSDGKFEFPEIEAGQYTVSVSKTNYNSDSKSVNVQSGTTTADFTITTGNGSIELSKSTLDFGTTDNTLVFDIENIGKNELTYTVACSEYDWLTVDPKSGTIASSRIEPITVTIDRSKITESKNITLPISSDAGSDEIIVKVTYNASAAVLSVTPTTLDFGESSSSKYFVVKNDGTEDLTFEFLGAEEWFTASCSKYTLTPGESTTVTVTIDRDKLTKTESYELIVSSNVGNESVTINATYVAKIGVLSVTPTSLDFGESSSSKYFTVSNTGNAELTFSIPNSEEWFSVECSNYTVAANSSSIVTVRIDRSKVTSSTSYSLVVLSDGGNANVALSVTAVIPTPVLTLYTTEVDFGESLTTETFTIYNTGTAELTYSVNESASWLSASYSGSVAAGGSAIVTLTIDRSNIYGSVSEDITITSDGGSKSITVKAYEPIDYGTVVSPYNNLNFEITEVYTSGNYMYIEYVATWSGSEPCDFYTFSYTSIAYDNNGNTYTTDFENVSLGGSSYTESKYLLDIPAGTIFKGGIRFKNITTDSTKLTSVLLKSAHQTDSGKYETGSVYFYNVPIIR